MKTNYTLQLKPQSQCSTTNQVIGTSLCYEILYQCMHPAFNCLVRMYDRNYTLVEALRYKLEGHGFDSR
jgi:hypothetical protein